jgi:integrase
VDTEEAYPTPGLRWRPRKGGRVPYWFPAPSAVKAGYVSTAINLQAYAHDPLLLSQKCCLLTNRVNTWLDENRPLPQEFDGTIGSVLWLYQTHKRSPFAAGKLAPGTMHPYRVYLRRLTTDIGAVRVEQATGFDAQDWFALWSDDGEKLAAGHMAICVLKAALKFASLAGHRSCDQLRMTLRDLSLPAIKGRTEAATPEQIEALIRAAHQVGRPSLALCFALQFETTLRLWDVRGQWYPLSDKRISDVISGGLKWLGLRWEDIGRDGILRYTPSKTERSSGATVVIDLALCPMALTELERVPAERRTGPVVLNEGTGLPYRQESFEKPWRVVRGMAGLPHTFWARDIRASAITEARKAGAPTDDARKVAGHTDTRTTDLYERENLDAFRRVATARLARRGAMRSGE